MEPWKNGKFTQDSGAGGTLYRKDAFGGRLTDSLLDHTFASRMFSLQYKASENKTKQPNTLSNKSKWSLSIKTCLHISAICL